MDRTQGFISRSETALDTPIPDNVTSIDFPKTGEMLVLEFNSVNGVHWVDGLHDTNYMCHVFDAIVLREPFDVRKRNLPIVRQYQISSLILRQ